MVFLLFCWNGSGGNCSCEYLSSNATGANADNPVQNNVYLKSPLLTVWFTSKTPNVGSLNLFVLKNTKPQMREEMVCWL